MKGDQSETPWPDAGATEGKERDSERELRARCLYPPRQPASLPPPSSSSRAGPLPATLSLSLLLPRPPCAVWAH